MSTRAYLEAIPELAAEAFATFGTRVVSDDGDHPHAVPGSRPLADLDRLLAGDRTPARPIPPRVWHYPGADDATRAREQAEDAKLQQRHASLGTLFGWVRVHHDDERTEGRETWLPADDVASVCTWLGVRLEWAERQEWAHEYREDVRRLWGQLRAICHVADAKPLPCLTDGCRGGMTEADGMLMCEHGHRHDGLRKWRLHPSMLDLDVAEALNVPVGTIRSWKSRGKIGADPVKSTRAESYVWPWDVLRMRYPEWVGAIEAAEKVA